MTRILPALALLAVTAVAQAQTADDQFPKPSAENPSAAEALKSWFGSRAAAKPVPATATISTPKRAVKPAIATTAPRAANHPTLEPTLASAPATSLLPAQPSTTASAPAVLRVPSAAPAVKAAGCRRIISAYYQGKRTASGAAFNPHGLTAAHRTLPFGTKIVVTNPRTGKQVTVTINDRGPYVRGVSLDLSLGAAKAIGMRGTTAVCMARL
jgi:rare lipoprotein A